VAFLSWLLCAWLHVYADKIHIPVRTPKKPPHLILAGGGYVQRTGIIRHDTCKICDKHVSRPRELIHVNNLHVYTVSHLDTFIVTVDFFSMQGAKKIVKSIIFLDLTENLMRFL